jgi:hypothetical protein
MLQNNAISRSKNTKTRKDERLKVGSKGKGDNPLWVP